MRPVNLLVLAVYFLTASSSVAQSAEPWIPITPADLAIKDVPGDPGAPAIRLYYSYFRNDDKKFELSYERIKILNDAGKKYADVEIPLEPKDSLKDLKARTIHPDGSIIECWEIDALFTGLARAAGFDASMLMVNDRYERSFNKYILWLGQLSGLGVMVNVEGKQLFLDPGTPVLPFGVLAPRYSETTALIVKPGAGFVTTPPAPRSSIDRHINVALMADGSAKGEISLELNGPRALEERLNSLDTDEAGRRKDLEDEVAAWLPSRAVVKMTDSDGWTSSEGPLSAKFTLEIPSLASATTPFKGLASEITRPQPGLSDHPITRWTGPPFAPSTCRGSRLGITFAVPNFLQHEAPVRDDG